MAYSAFEVARYIIHHEAQQNRPVSNLRLQKLLYFVQAKFVMDSHGTSPCFYEKMEAWGFGPVVREVYYEYRYYGGAMIPPERNFSTTIAPRDQSMLDDILNDCAQFSTSALVDITHSQILKFKMDRFLLGMKGNSKSIFRTAEPSARWKTHFGTCATNWIILQT